MVNSSKGFGQKLPIMIYDSEYKEMCACDMSLGHLQEDYISKLNEVTGHKMPNSERIEILQI